MSLRLPSNKTLPKKNHAKTKQTRKQPKPPVCDCSYKAKIKFETRVILIPNSLKKIFLLEPARHPQTLASLVFAAVAHLDVLVSNPVF